MSKKITIEIVKTGYVIKVDDNEVHAASNVEKLFTIIKKLVLGRHKEKPETKPSKKIKL